MAAPRNVYWHPVPVPLYSNDGKPEERQDFETEQRLREDRIATHLSRHPLPDIKPGDVVMLAHNGPVLIGAGLFGPDPTQFEEFFRSEQTVNWVSLGLDHRLAGIWDTWGNGKSLDPRQVQGIADTVNRLGSSELASLLFGIGDGSEADEVTEVVARMGPHEGIVQAMIGARARAQIFDRETVDVEDILHGVFHPAQQDDVAEALFRIYATAPSLRQAMEEGWVRTAGDIDGKGLSEGAFALLETAAGFPSGLRIASLVCVVLFPDKFGQYAQLLEHPEQDPLWMASRILQVAGDPDHATWQMTFFRDGLKVKGWLEAAEQGVSKGFDAPLVSAERARAIARGWLLPERILTPPSRTDQPGETDYLDVDDEAKAFARLIALEQTRMPLSIGVFGNWGSGKTFFLNAVEREVTKISASVRREIEGLRSNGDAAAPSPGTATGYLGNIVPIKFNAWHYMEANIWASLVDVIFHDLEAWQRGNQPHAVGDLFKKVTATQEDRLDALEAWANKLVEADKAQSDIVEASRNFRDNGPTGGAFLKSLGQAMWDSSESKATIAAYENARKELAGAGVTLPPAGQRPSDAEGFENFGKSVKDLQNTIAEAQDKGGLLAGRVRKRVNSPAALFVLALGFLGAPILVSWASAHYLGLQSALPGLATIVSTFTAGAAIVSSGVRQGLAMLEKFTETVEDLEASDPEILALKAKQTKAAANLQDAQGRLEIEEKAAEDALAALQNETIASRLSRLLRARTEGDIYTRHLGVVATIRKDFELLSGLLSRPEAEREREAWNAHEERSRHRLKALREKYKDILSKSESNAARQKRLHREQIRRDLGDLSVPDDIATALSRDIEVVDYGAKLKERLKTIEDDLANAPEKYARIDRIMLVVDDLDRCPPEKVYAVLQAVHLFLSFPIFVVMVGVDTRWMETALIKELGELVNSKGGATPRDYLEKIFQIPYWTKPLNEDGAKAMARGILTAMAPATSEDQGQTQTGLVEPDSGVASTLQSRSGINEGGTEDMERKDDILPGADVPDVEMVRPSEAEVAFMSRISGFAGTTPRQVIRLANVFMLMKAAQSTSLERQGVRASTLSGDGGSSRAALTQLAICTGSGDAAAGYFQALAEVAASKERTHAALQKAVMRRLSGLGAAKGRVLGLLNTYADEVPQDANAIDWLIATAQDAQTYTFAAARVAGPETPERQQPEADTAPSEQPSASV